MIEADNGAEKVAQLPNWRTSDVYSDKERLVIEYGERMTTTGASVDDEFFDKLRAQFSEAEIVELTAGIAMENFRSKFNAPLKIQAQGFCPLPGG